MPQEPQTPYLLAVDAAKRYGMTNDHVGLLCRRAKVEGKLLGRQWYVNEDSLRQYVQKSSELKEVRRSALSRQWRAAWAALFAGLVLWSAGPSVASAATFTVIYAQDYAPEQEVASNIEPLGFLMHAASVNAAAVIATVPAPDLSYQASQRALLMTRQNIYNGMVVANEALRAFNDGMFSIYQESLYEFGLLVRFDSQQIRLVLGSTFGAFGKRFVADARMLNAAQVDWYFSVAQSLQQSYNAYADVSERMPVLPMSISVASVIAAPGPEPQ